MAKPHAKSARHDHTRTSLIPTMASGSEKYSASSWWCRPSNAASMVFSRRASTASSINEHLWVLCPLFAEGTQESLQLLPVVLLSVNISVTFPTFCLLFVAQHLPLFLYHFACLYSANPDCWGTASDTSVSLNRYCRPVGYDAIFITALLSRSIWSCW